MGHMWAQLHRQFDDHANNAFGCTFRNMKIVGKTVRGLRTNLKFQCDMCQHCGTICSESKAENVLDSNTAAVFGSVAIGIGHYQLE